MTVAVLENCFHDQVIVFLELDCLLSGFKEVTRTSLFEPLGVSAEDELVTLPLLAVASYYEVRES